MVRALISSVLCSVVTSEEVSSLLQTRANNDADCTRKNKCTTTTTTPEQTCADYQCPVGMKDLSGAITCSSDGCTQHDCCEEHTCEDFYQATQCPSNMDQVDPAKACQNQCSEQQCCKEKPSCAKYTCPRNMEKKANMRFCVGRCTQSQCCQTTTTTTTQQTCAQYRCPNNMDDDDKSVVCTGTCTADQCCKTTTTTTTPPIGEKKEPPPKPPTSNCPVPPKPQVCHFWGEPHFNMVFGKGDQGWDRTQHRAGRMPTAAKHRVLEFHEAGLWRIAKADGHEVQAFFCEGPDINVNINGQSKKYDPTSSACAIAIKMKDGSKIVIMRNPKTKGGRGNQWSSNMKVGDPDIVEIYVNGEKKEWYDLSKNGKKSGSAVAVNVPEDALGRPVGKDTFISQLHSKSKREGGVSTAPLCVGDIGGSLMVDVAVSVVSGDWPMVYEMSVTVLATNPEQEGICGDAGLRNKINSGRSGGSGYLSAQDEAFYRVEAKDSIFSSLELKELYKTCDMDMMSNHLKPAIRDRKKVGGFCVAKAKSARAAASVCKAFTGDEPWLTTCMIEYCAHGDRALALMDAEEEFEKEFPQMKR